MTHSAILVNSMIENSTDENSPVVNTSDEDHDKIDYEHIYFINLSRNYFNYIVLYSLIYIVLRYWSFYYI
jgi:hypothetical protein